MLLRRSGGLLNVQISGACCANHIHMNKPKKHWIKPAVRNVPISRECTCCVGAV